MDTEKIAKFIKKLRLENNYSQNSLSEKIHVTRQAISNWETGKAIPDSDILIELSELFNVSINEILSGEFKEKANNMEEIALSLVDENNKKKLKIKRLIMTFSTVIILILISFLTYYFISNYNSIKIYTIKGESDIFETYNGMMIVTKNKSYIRINKIESTNKDSNYNIQSIKLYYKDKRTKKVLSQDNYNEAIILNEIGGYDEFNINKNIKKIIKNLYLKINYNDKQCSIIHLKLKKDFSNNLSELNSINKLKIKHENDNLSLKSSNPQVEKMISEEMEKTKTLDLVRREIINESVDNNEVNTIENKPEQIIDNSNEIPVINEDVTPNDNQKEEPEEKILGNNSEDYSIITLSNSIIETIKEIGIEQFGTYQYELLIDNEYVSINYGFNTLNIDIIYGETIESIQYINDSNINYTKLINYEEEEFININLIETKDNKSTYYNYLKQKLQSICTKIKGNL